MTRDERGPWYLLTGLVLGVLMGLLYAWWFRPVSYTNTTPASLRAEYKDQYRALIAAAYLANGDLVRAKARLDLLKDADVYRALAEQAQRMLADGSSPQEARGLGLLAIDLGQMSATVPSSPQSSGGTPADGTSTDAPSADTFPGVTPSLELTLTLSGAVPVTQEASSIPPAEPISSTENPPGSPTPAPLAVAAGRTGSPSPTAARTLPATQTLPATRTPFVTRTPSPEPAALYVLDSRNEVCDPSLVDPLIQVEVLDASGEPAPGVEMVVSWDGGEDGFFTGLKPELGLGYADFNMTPGVTYTLRLAETGEQIPGLTSFQCKSGSGERFWGSLLLTFKQP